MKMNAGIRKSFRRETRLQYQTLEPRNLLATFVGSGANDIATVNYVDGAPQTVEFNGDTTEVNGEDVHFDFGGGYNRLSVFGDNFSAIINGGDLLPNGSVNDDLSFTVSDNFHLVTGNGTDTVDLTAPNGDFESLRDRFIVNTTYGNDTVTYHGGRARVVLGLGDDVIKIGTEDYRKLGEVLAGEGNDTFQFLEGIKGNASIDRVVDGQAVLMFNVNQSSKSEFATGTFLGFERVLAVHPSTLEAGPNAADTNNAGGFRYDNGKSDFFPEWIVEGDIATLANEDVTVPLIVENFDQFNGGYARIDVGGDFGSFDSLSGKVAVLSSGTYPIGVKAETVNIGFVDNPALGDTSAITRWIFISKASSLTASDASETGTVDVQLDSLNFRYRGLFEDSIVARGLAPAPIAFSSRLLGDVHIHGSSTNVNRFYVDANNNVPNIRNSIVFFGGAGNDRLFLSSKARDLSQFLKPVAFIGGDGYDYALIYDDQSTGQVRYRIDDDGVFRSKPQQSFPGVSLVGVEDARLFANDDPNVFVVTPSNTLNYHISGGGPDIGMGDEIVLLLDEDFGNQYAPAQIPGQDRYAYYFLAASGIKPIRFSSIETLKSEGRLAVGSAAGVKPRLEVLKPRLGTFAFSADVFHESYFGGVAVATGNIDGDFIPDVVAAQSTSGRSLIRVFDGKNGKHLGAFFGFDDFFGGIDIAVGNVMGDSRNEIIVSRVDGGNHIRIFESGVDEAGGLTYKLVHDYKPFGDEPAAGAKVSLGNIGATDNYVDIVASAVAGWKPVVVVHELHTGVPVKIRDFLVADENFRGGVDVTVNESSTLDLSAPLSDIWSLVHYPETANYAARNEVIYIRNSNVSNDRNQILNRAVHIYDPGEFGETPIAISVGTTGLFKSGDLYVMAASERADGAATKEIYTFDETNGLQLFRAASSDLFLNGGNLG